MESSVESIFIVGYRTFSHLRDRVCSIFSSAGKFCLAHALRQLTRDKKSDVSCLQTSLTRRNEKLRMTFKIGRQVTTLVVKML